MQSLVFSYPVVASVRGLLSYSLQCVVFDKLYGVITVYLSVPTVLYLIIIKIARLGYLSAIGTVGENVR